MEVVFIKNNKFIKFDKYNVDGYKFIPRRKNIDSLTIVNNNIINYVLNKKINREIKKVDKTIKLMINSDVTLVSDCDMMEEELKRLINIIVSKYMNFFDEFEFFQYIKNIYVLNKVINLKKKMINEVI